MTHLIQTKTLNGWIPADQTTADFHQKQRLGSDIHSDWKQMRNSKFHRKFFALIGLAYQYWEPGEIDSKYGVPEKDPERFREDLIILAGYYHLVIRLDGTTRIEADSIKFGRMDQETFERLYSNVLDVILQKISILKDMAADEVNALVDQVIGFA